MGLLECICGYGVAPTADDRIAKAMQTFNLKARSPRPATISRRRRDSWPSHFHESGFRAGIQLREDAHARYDRLRRIRKHICRMSNREFDKILQKKGSSGALRFDHEDATLKMTYQKDNQDETTQIDNIQSLSGGERSFSTLAMLVSLGATIECPFRVMDEFDVFMDQVSRKVAMQELVDMAREMPNRQFVFITPQDLSSLPQSNPLKVFKLNAPIRGQQTLDGFATKKRRTTQGG